MSRKWVAVVSGSAVLALVVAVGVGSDNQHLLTIAIQTMLLAALASSWNILGGFAGQISLGHAVFFGLGALTTRELWLAGLPLPVSVVAALVVTAVFAALVGVPMLRFRDIYFTIGTLALGVAIFLTVSNVRPRLTSLSADALRTYDFTSRYFMTLGVLVVTVAVAMWLKSSKVGLGMMAVRDDEEAAASTGVSPLSHKMVAFVVSAVLAALAGASFAYFTASYYPSFPFSVVWTFEAILVAFVGGVGTITGPLIGAVFFVVGRDALPSSIEEFQVVVFGLLFILVVLLLPGGLLEGAQRLIRRGSKQDTRSTSNEGTTKSKGKELV
ncbi:MAG TPA: branched-chain amino acid ABC transporter permease [Acidimicrobiia bacterium]|nr:branched-chain amino acid ABC transporter permease [Acidimicrobiia bacterium]